MSSSLRVGVARSPASDVHLGSAVSCLAFCPRSLVKEMTNQYGILFKQEQAHDDAIWSVAWGTNKKENSETVVTGSLDDLVKVWKWRDERLDLQWSLEGHQLGVVSVDISHTLPIAASSSLDAHIRLWDLENGKQIKSIDAGPEILCLPYSELLRSLPYGSLECKAQGPYRSVSYSPLLNLVKGCDSWYVMCMKLLRNIDFVLSTAEQHNLVQQP
uniref:Superkiller complex protein 8 n=1 Tax=Callithrix jacchus TaxID=9483 RepID=A0A5F4WC25_CALJA